MIPDFQAASQIRDVHDTINSNSRVCLAMIIIPLGVFSMKRSKRKEVDDFCNVILSLEWHHRRRSFHSFYRVFYARMEIDGNPYVGWSLNILSLAILWKFHRYYVIYHVRTCQGSVIFFFFHDAIISMQSL